MAKTKLTNIRLKKFAKVQFMFKNLTKMTYQVFTILCYGKTTLKKKIFRNQLELSNIFKNWLIPFIKTILLSQWIFYL